MGLIEDISKKFAKTYKNAAKASGEIIEETKLRLSIINEQNKVDELYEKLGKKVYELYEKGELLNEDFNEYCLQIQNMKQNIEAMKKRIKELRNLKICPKCNLEINIEYHYCPQCGTKQEIPVTKKIKEEKKEQDVNHLD